MIAGKWNHSLSTAIFVVTHTFILKDKYFFLLCSDALERDFFLLIFVEALMTDSLCLYLQIYDKLFNLIM